VIRKLFLENIGLKASAVIFAVILWFFVVSKGQTEISLKVPIDFSNIPQGLEIAKRSVNSVNVVVRTHESLSRNIKPENVTIFVDVSKAKEGEEIFPINTDDAKVPFGATVVEIEPSTVRAVFEETLSKKVSVNPDVIGSPQSGYYVKSVEVTPSEVVIEGPKSEVRRVNVLRTEPIDLSGLSEDFRQRAEIELPNGNTRAKVDRVEVHVSIERRGK
jgi:YbbR domain-containing protein